MAYGLSRLRSHSVHGGNICCSTLITSTLRRGEAGKALWRSAFLHAERRRDFRNPCSCPCYQRIHAARGEADVRRALPLAWPSPKFGRTAIPRYPLHPSIHAQKLPDKPAVVMAATGETLTYRQLDDRSNQAAQLFRELGLKTGDGIAVFMENDVRYFEICWAAQRSGLYYTCISSRLTAGEVEYIAKDCAAQVLIVSHGLAKVAGELVARLPGVKLFMLGGTMPGYASFEEAAGAQPAKRIADESAGLDMLYSSGTTGRPKGVRHALDGSPIDAPNALLALVGMLFGLNQETVYLSPAPLYHAAPLRYCMSMHRMGATVVVMDHFDAEKALEYIEKYRITGTQVVPTMFVRMLKLPQEVRAKYDVSSLKSAIHAAAPCPIEVKNKMIEWWGPVIHEYYAGTEGNGFCYVSSAEWLAHPGTVGRALVGEVHICGENGEELPRGEEGVIYFGGGAQFEYHNDP